jgi:hypothetical protein
MMKKIFSLLMILLPLMASAQNESRRVSLEPRGGLTISKMNGSALQLSETWKTGCTAGVEVEIPLSRYYSLTTGADISDIGTGTKKQYMNDGYSTVKEKLVVTYVTVPLQMKAYFKGVRGLSAHLGLQAGFLVRARDKATIKSIRTMDLGDGTSSMYLWENYTEKKTENVSSKFRNVVAGIPMGLSFEYRNVMIDATYTLEVLRQAMSFGFSNEFMYGTVSARNYPIYITIGYKFRL